MRNLGLPYLEKIQVNNFSLYKQQPSFSYEFKEGINAILGINGIGKTTFIEMILYSLVGFELDVSETKKTGKKKMTKKNVSFFYDRCDPRVDNSLASVTLLYRVRGKKVIIERSLVKDEILCLKINGIVMGVSEEEYNKFLVEIIGVTDFVSVQTIIRTFLIFDEQRLNVAWEVKTQDEILKILLLDEEMQGQIADLERAVSGLDTKGRHKSEDRRIIRDRISILKEERVKVSNEVEELLEEESKIIKLDDLLVLKNRLNDEVDEMKQEVETKKEVLNILESNYNRIIGERNDAGQRIEKLTSEEELLQSKMYKSIYDKFPDYYFTLEKNLINQGECLICGAKSHLLKDRFTLRKKQKQCIVCENIIEQNVNFDEGDINKMNELYEMKADILVFIGNKEQEIKKISGEMDNLRRLMKEISEKIMQKESSLIEVKSRITKNLPESPPKDVYELMIKNLDNEAEKLTKEIDTIYFERDKAKKELDALRNKFVDNLKRLNKKISNYFNKYASTFLGVDCQLILKQQTIRFIPRIIFMPKISGLERGSIYSVSESQRFFLDQAFRMAIIHFLSDEIEGFNTFFITETPEGSLDLAYEEQVAKMFKVFAKSNNNIVFTSNLNSSNFLNKIFDDIEIPEARILNMLKKGNPTLIQKNYSEIFEEKIREIATIK